MYAVANLNKVNANTKYVTIIKLHANTIKVLKNKAPYTILTVGETEEEALDMASCEWFLNHAIADGWYKLVALDEIEVF